MSHRNAFSRFAAIIAAQSGRPATFIFAVVLIIAWAATGPMFHFGDTWQLVVNTGTTIITFLMVFLIQNTQNRDTAALQIKLDELIRTSKANNALLNLEELDEKTLERIRIHYCHLASHARDDLDEFESGNGPGPGPTDAKP